MVDKEPAADCRARVNLDVSEKAADVGQESRQEKEPNAPQPVSGAMHPDRMQAGVAE